LNTDQFGLIKTNKHFKGCEPQLAWKCHSHSHYSAGDFDP